MIFPFIHTGPAEPVQPVGLTFINTTFTTATLQWTVPYIAYTPETYQIYHGTDETMLDLSSKTVTGSSDLEVINQVFTVDLTELIHDTTYYYQVIATNSYTTTESDITTFMTIPIRKLLNHLS